MKTEDIKWLDIPSITDKNAHLYLWVTNNFLEDGLEVMKHWGFRYVTNVAWVKDRFGLGYYFRGQHELCLFGVKGVMPPKHKDFDKEYPEARWSGTEQKEGVKTPTTVLQAKRQAHSQKPEEFYSIVETVSHEPYVEIFARRSRDKWDSWGNELATEIKL